MRLLLFDIDGTLLTCGPQVRPWFADALVAVYGTAGAIDGYDFAGRTDPEIVQDLVGDPCPERLGRMRRRYLDALDRHLDAAAMRLMPGVRPLLDELVTRDDVVVALLTGNWERGARIKLARLGLEPYFRLGAFAEDGPARRDLPPVALSRACQHTGREFGAADALVIGDSVHDVACARAHRVPVLAVATSHTPAARLAAAGADRVISDLTAISADELVSFGVE
ncbi:MAG: HAD family hydrolase [Thermoanaerobaculia bacterium]|nr:HAD family hydrolase [Thermoanaerobaculia bacterium]